jgi:hypothetical protein
MSKININDAAQVVVDTDIAALNAIKDILDETAAKLADVEATLSPSITLDALRILRELTSSYNYRRTMDIPAILARYETPALGPIDPV